MIFVERGEMLIGFRRSFGGKTPPDPRRGYPSLTAEITRVQFPTGADLINFVNELRLEIPDPRSCIEQPETMAVAA